MVRAMSFIGTPIIEQTAPNIIRITGIQLASEASGTIALPQATGTPPDITLPSGFQVPDGEASLAARVRVAIEPVTADGLTNLPPSIEKTGDTREDFRILITNTNVQLTTQELEIYIDYPAAASVTKNVRIGPVITVVDGEVTVD